MQQFTVASGLVVTVEADNDSITIRDGGVSGSGASMIDPVAIAAAPDRQDVLDRAELFRLSAADGTTVRMERADFERVMRYLEQPTVVAQALSISRDLRGHLLCFPDGRLPRVGFTLDQHRIN